MDKNIKVSVIIPTYNRADLISEAIESVLVQTYKDLEIIVIDDASTDTTQEILKNFSSKHNNILITRHETNQGISVTRNEGLALARGKYIAMLDSDDIWLDPTKLEQQVTFLDNYTDHLIVGTFMTVIDEKGVKGNEIKFETEDSAIRTKLLGTNQFMQSSLVFNKEAAQNAGGYDATLPTMEDHDLWLKMLKIGKGANLPIFGLGYRVHAGSVSMQKRRRIAVDEFRVIRRHLRTYPKGSLHALTKGFARVVLAYLNLY